MDDNKALQGILDSVEVANRFGAIRELIDKELACKFNEIENTDNLSYKMSLMREADHLYALKNILRTFDKNQSLHCMDKCPAGHLETILRLMK